MRAGSTHIRLLANNTDSDCPKIARYLKLNIETIKGIPKVADQEVVWEKHIHKQFEEIAEHTGDTMNIPTLKLQFAKSLKQYGYHKERAKVDQQKVLDQP